MSCNDMPGTMSPLTLQQRNAGGKGSMYSNLLLKQGEIKMSLTGLFKAVCYDSLTSYGFKYKNRTFYRIHGDGMFQAISVWDRTHYEINAVNAPIWSLEDKIHLYVCELCGKGGLFVGRG